MRRNEQPEPDHVLDRALREWSVETPLPPRFQEQVWQRIARGESRAAGVLAGVMRLLEVVLPTPKVAYCYLAVLLAFGLVAGAWAAQQHNHRLESALGSRYLQSIDPLQTASLNP